MKYISILILGFTLISCNPNDQSWKLKIQHSDYLHKSMKALTDVIVHDIFSPPVASRIYAYPNIAAYEILQQPDPKFATLFGQLKDFPQISGSDSSQIISHEIAALSAFNTVGRTLIFSEDKMDQFNDELFRNIKRTGVPSSILEASIKYGEEVAQQILNWADKDNYKQTRTQPKYGVTEEVGRWTPTPPDYMGGIEPHWSKIRTFVLDSADQFRPEPPTPYNLDTQSNFYKEVIEVYDAVRDNDSNQVAIAKFWDCNPFVSNHKGHFNFATKKITPGGHWMGITAIATKLRGDDLLHTARSFTMVAIALADGFISCWDEKYTSNLIRPETVINEYIDAEWVPILQTPPFPEYTSGHSVVSGAAATALTDIYGDDFDYIDDVEVEYGLPFRHYNSFFEAADEAAISRLYGGIHYKPAIVFGLKQGKQVGQLIVDRLTFKK